MADMKHPRRAYAVPLGFVPLAKQHSCDPAIVERNARIRAEVDEGADCRAMAEKYGLKPGTIWVIVRRSRRQGGTAPS